MKNDTSAPPAAAATAPLDGNGRDGGAANNSDIGGGASSSSSQHQRASRRVPPPAHHAGASAANDTKPGANNNNTASVDSAANILAATNLTFNGAAPAPQPPPRVVVPRPPLNVYLKIAIMRDDDDAVICEDPERPGKTKKIAMGQLKLDGNNNKDQGGSDAHDIVGAVTSNANDNSSDGKKHSFSGAIAGASNNNNNNKKEIPVPTITTVRRYDTDIPPNYSIPTSYVRNVCPTYDEVMEGSVEYTVDGEDECWWKDNLDFGPYSMAKIIVPENEEGHKFDNEGNGSVTTTGEVVGGGDAAAEKEGDKAKKEKLNRNKKGKFAKKSSSKRVIDDAAKEGAMDVDEATGTTSDASCTTPKQPPSSRKNYTIEQVLLLNPKYLHSQHSTNYLLAKYNPKLPLPLFERMLDMLEKATGFEFVISNARAEEMLVRRMPELIDIFGPLSARERRMEEEDDERHLRRWLRNSIDGGGGGTKDGGS